MGEDASHHFEVMSGSEVRLHVEERGQGRPVVLMHGFGGSARNFLPQARALSDRYRIVTFDARGHARSEAPGDPEAYSLEALVADVDRIVRNQDEGVVLGGLSMGAAVALHYAFEHESRLAGLVLAAFPPGSQGGEQSWPRRFAEAIETRGLESAGAEFVWGGGRFDADAQKLIRRGFTEHPPHALAHLLRRLLDRLPDVASLVPRLAGLSLPTLVVVGSEDAASMAPSRALANAIPNARFEIVGGAGHVVNLAAPKAFNDLLLDFLRKIDAS